MHIDTIKSKNRRKIRMKDDTKLGIGGLIFVGFLDGMAAFAIVLMSAVIGSEIFHNLLPFNDWIYALSVFSFIVGFLIVGKETPEYPRFHTIIKRNAIVIYMIVFFLACISFTLGAGR
jgi:hypothetical protein